MAVAASSATQLLLSICSPSPTSRTRSTNNTPIAFCHHNTHASRFSRSRAFLVRAAESEKEGENSNKNEPDDSALLSQEDLNYLVKLGAGSVVGAAAIKYGSVVFPEITRPNITEALAIISFPVIAAVLLLIWQSRSE